MRSLFSNQFASSLLCIAGAVALPACSVTYPVQAARGHLALVNQRVLVTELLDSVAVDPAIRARLEDSREILDFAHRELLLPDNGSYRYYSDTGRPYVIWNVFAAPEFSLSPQRWCFPVAGCVSYRGYFAEDAAAKFATRLNADGYDTYVGGVRAYSTLGNFKDPLLNTMMAMPDIDFIGLLFHELAHQKLYVQDDSSFNESFATAVEEAGLRRWFELRGTDLPDRSQYEQRRRDVLELLEETRRTLKRVYRSDLEASEKRARKAAIFAGLTEGYAELDKRWASELGPELTYRRPYAGFIAQGLNNASLLAVSTYTDYVLAFERLLIAVCDDQLACFYEAARELGDMPAAARSARLAQLDADARRMADILGQ